MFFYPRTTRSKTPPLAFPLLLLQRATAKPFANLMRARSLRACNLLALAAQRPNEFWGVDALLFFGVWGVEDAHFILARLELIPA